MDVGDIAGAYSAMVSQQTSADVSMAVLAKTLKAQTAAAATLISAMPKLPAFGELGQNLDVRA